ncbi:MAG: Ig-like domain-containing protein [Dethiobacteria bacterium]|nr:Ig-like domain-containing protein [Dethiobacteria bacterium]
MEKSRTSRRTTRLIIVALLLLLLVALALFYFFANNRAIESTPLVLIHSPLNREPFQVGERITIHATARGANGLSSVELWVNDTFVDVQNAPEDSSPNALVFSSSWFATSAGNNVIIVRAVASDGTRGQASIVIEVSDREGAEAGIHTVREGETLRIIADEYGLEPEELEFANPWYDLGELGPGDEIVIPDDEEPPAEISPPADEPPGSDPPFPDGLAPRFDFDFLLLSPLQDYFVELLGAGQADEPARLRLELLSLTTTVPYEQLYLYVSYADFPRHRYPDGREDPGADDSFTVLASDADGTTMWNVAGLADSTLPAFNWPRNANLPIRVSCVGITDGGTDSEELGHWEGMISSEYWTGMTLEGGVAGSYDFTFRLSPHEGGERGIPLFLDHTMTPPSNARLDDRRNSLRWDYEPQPDEEPIDGFRIYLNGNLQWVEPADSRESMLPYEWFNPPCGTNYVFAVTAYRIGIPDGPESLPAIYRLEQEAENCQREIMITFLELETFDLGGDGRRPAHHGDVGPVYGYFYANEKRITFDTRAPDSGGGSLDMPNGLRHNTVYNLAEMAADPTWHFNPRLPVLLVDIPDDGAFEFGFHIMDQDQGRCRNSSDPGCDDLVAEGLSPIYQVDSSMAWIFDQQNEGTLVAANGRCRVTYVWGPAFGSPVGSGVEGWEPLPWIALEDFVVDENTGQVRLHVRNTGSATWPWRDLKIELLSRDGVSFGIYTWPEFVLESGQRTVLEHPDMRLDPPFDACVLIDPFDDVLEEYERSGAMIHSPICSPTPDLVITDVHYLPGEDTGQMAVTIRNIGEDPLVNRTVSIEAFAGRLGSLDIGDSSSMSTPNVTLERFQSRTLIFGEVSNSTREQMREGYRVVVNSDGSIYEHNMSNNSFEVPAADRLMIRVMDLYAPWSLRNNVDFRLTAHAVSGDARREVANLYFSDIDWSTRSRDRGCSVILDHGNRNNSVSWFPIFGDESLEVTVRSTHRSGSWRNSDIYLPRDNWRANGWGSTRGCSDRNHSSPGWHPWILHRDDGHQLGLTFQVCRETE